MASKARTRAVRSEAKPNYVAAHRKAAGLSDHELAAKIGTSQPQINRLENGARKLTVDWLQKIAGALGKPVEELFSPPATTTVNEHPQILPHPVEQPVVESLSSFPNAALSSTEVARTASRRRIDILGRSSGGRDGKFFMNGESVGQIFCPPSVEAASNPYAVFVYGTSMEPRYEDGEMVIANPDVPYHRGHYVVVQLTTDEEYNFECYVKRFVSFNSKELVLEQLNPPRGQEAIMRFPAKRVGKIHKLVGPDGR